jgi:NAD(P)-dependent dehydrogenase (short-subunit alcohol dehydrogenase family)
MMDLLKLFRLDGRTALVTGSSRGLGKEIALNLAQSGASMILADIVYPEKTAKEIKSSGARCISMQVDISNEKAVKNLLTKSISEYQKVEILVNNAGIGPVLNTPTEDMPIEQWDRIIGVNLRGTYLCCKYFGKHMINTGGGNIVNISSTAGINGASYATAYSASKGGVILLTKCLALEWARYNIRVNAVAPHFLETEFIKDLRNSEKLYGGLIKQIPLKRFGKTSEIIGTILLLCSNASSYITGTVVVVDGGFLAK